MNSPFTEPSIRTGYIESIVEWISKNAPTEGLDQDMIRASLRELDDRALLEKGASIQEYIRTSSHELQRIGRNVQSLEHTLDEEQERASVSLPSLLNF